MIVVFIQLNKYFNAQNLLLLFELRDDFNICILGFGILRIFIFWPHSDRFSISNLNIASHAVLQQTFNISMCTHSEEWRKNEERRNTQILKSIPFMKWDLLSFIVILNSVSHFHWHFSCAMLFLSCNNKWIFACDSISIQRRIVCQSIHFHLLQFPQK